MDSLIRKHYSIDNRKVGKTHHLCQLAKKINAIVICHDGNEAKRIRNEYKIDAISISERRRLYGTRQPVLLDQDAAIRIISDLCDEIGEKREEIRKLSRLISQAKRVLKNFPE